MRLTTEAIQEAIAGHGSQGSSAQVRLVVIKRTYTKQQTNPALPSTTRATSLHNELHDPQTSRFHCRCSGVRSPQVNYLVLDRSRGAGKPNAISAWLPELASTDVCQRMVYEVSA